VHDIANGHDCLITLCCQALLQLLDVCDLCFQRNRLFLQRRCIFFRLRLSFSRRTMRLPLTFEGADLSSVPSVQLASKCGHHMGIARETQQTHVAIRRHKTEMRSTFIFCPISLLTLLMSFLYWSALKRAAMRNMELASTARSSCAAFKGTQESVTSPCPVALNVSTGPDGLRTGL
jgi:hypothetical protein